jgi:hypothetical protein
MKPAAGRAGGPTGKAGGPFDLARFAAMVLNIGNGNIGFADLAPGESLRALAAKH